jgi:hypothetical protein
MGAAARFNTPWGVVADDSGNVFVIDMDNRAVRRITPDGVVTTFAGVLGSIGFQDGTGARARFFRPPVSHVMPTAISTSGTVAQCARSPPTR